MKSHVVLLTYVFEKFIKVAGNEYEVNPLCSVSLSGFTYQCGLKNFVIRLQTFQNKDKILFFQNNIRRGISSAMADSYVKSDENKKIMDIDATNLYGCAMSQSLPDDKLEFA